MKKKPRKALDYPDETQGSKLAAEIRKRANGLTAKQRAEYFRKGMAMIYGGTGTKEFSDADLAPVSPAHPKRLLRSAQQIL
jgi:hypothetical protein